MCVHQSPPKVAWLSNVRETDRKTCVNVLVGEVARIARKGGREYDEAGKKWQKKYRKNLPSMDSGWP